MIPQCIHGKFLRVRIPLERFAVDRVSGPLWVRGLGQFHENLADRVVEKSWRQMGLVPIEPLAIGSEISIELSWV